MKSRQKLVRLALLVMFFLHHQGFKLVNTTTSQLESFDYIIVGGGTAGLTVASRLSENTSLSVLVLEAGGTGINNTGISIPGFRGTTLGTDIDWKYSSTPQENANKRKILYPRGKVLGGSSAINFMMSTMADKDDYNAIESLGDPGWGWSEFHRAFKKAEHFIAPSKEYPFFYDPKVHGKSGPVELSFPRFLPPQFKPYFPATIHTSSIGRHAIQTTDPFDGRLGGAYIFPSAIDTNRNRVTSATAYWTPTSTTSEAASPMSQKQFNSIVNRIKNGTVVEFIPMDFFFDESTPDLNTSYLSIAVAIQHPLSRGSVHINSKDPSKAPSINPRFLSHPFDRWLMIQAAKHARKIMNQPEFKPFILNEQFPGPSVKSDEEWFRSIRDRVISEYHPLGTCAMLPRNQSGVVDPKLKVYDTKNLRIVDASILPIQLATHLAVTIYALAEKSVEIILQST